VLSSVNFGEASPVPNSFRPLNVCMSSMEQSQVLNAGSNGSDLLRRNLFSQRWLVQRTAKSY